MKKQKIVAYSILGIGMLMLIVFLVTKYAAPNSGLSVIGASNNGCFVSPLTINGQTFANVQDLQMKTGHTFSATEIDALKIQNCQGLVCIETCQVVSP